MEIVKTNTSIDVGSWYKCDLRVDVVDIKGEVTEQFILWQKRCLGRSMVMPEITNDEIYIPKKLVVYIEKEEDVVSYTLTFDERPHLRLIDAAVFYCPYIPLMTVSVRK